MKKEDEAKRAERKPEQKEQTKEEQAEAHDKVRKAKVSKRLPQPKDKIKPGEAPLGRDGKPM